MIKIKESHEVRSEIIPQILSMATEYGRLESTLKAVERWYGHQVEINKEYKSTLEELKPLGIILGIGEKPEEEQMPEAKAAAGSSINGEAGNASA